MRTFHALSLEILREAGQPIAPVLDRETVPRTAVPLATAAEWRRLATMISRLKLDVGVDAVTGAADPHTGATAREFVAYEAGLAEAGGLDFDDLVIGAARTSSLTRFRTPMPCCWRRPPTTSCWLAMMISRSSSRAHIARGPTTGLHRSQPMLLNQQANHPTIGEAPKWLGRATVSR